MKAEEKHELLGAFVRNPIALRSVLKLQALVRSLRARKAAVFKRAALKTADSIVEEGSQDPLSPFGLYMDLTMQIGILTTFTAASPWAAFIMLLLNMFDLRMRMVAVFFQLPTAATTQSPWHRYLVWSFHGCFLRFPLPHAGPAPIYRWALRLLLYVRVIASQHASASRRSLLLELHLDIHYGLGLPGFGRATGAVGFRVD